MNRNPLTAARLAGVWTALVTPFRGKNLDTGRFGELIDQAIDARLTGVVVLGSTGESPVITSAERSRLIEIAVRRSSESDLRVLVGVGSSDTRHAVEQAKQAAAAGADGLLVVTPYYNKPTQAGLRQYFLTIAGATDRPIVMYHIPGRCAVGISQELALELASHPRIIGMKDAGGDVSRVAELCRLAPDEFVILSGDDSLTLPMISVGAVGVVSVLSNIAPKLTNRMVSSALKGDFVTALEIHRQLAPLWSALFLETSPAPAKEAMKLIGLPVGEVRPPLVKVTRATREALKTALKHLGNLE
jgi:4-hydroxy-tetrahydrodipicolinate synthase